MTPKEIVKRYYEADLANETDLMEQYLHPECKLDWHSSKGFKSLDYEAIKALYNNIKKNYSATRVQISHILEHNMHVTTRYTLYVVPFETPDEEHPTAHYITIWEIKDNKLYRGHEISQLADTSTESLNSFYNIYEVKQN